MNLDGANKRFGFGCMRLPMKGDAVDMEEFTKMVDYFIENGFTYFDTAHGYLNGQSEIAIRNGLTSRYARTRYLLTNKLSEPYFQKQEDIEPFFFQQLEICGVEYFDYYLMHAQSRRNFPKFKACKAYETAFDLKRRGYIRHVGISFHDTAEVLEEILTTYPEIEVVQIQFNYLDYESPSVQSRKLYDVCQRHNKPIIVMEPVRGGALVNLPEEAKQVYDALGEMSYASYAIRFVLGHPQVAMVLSGMSNMEQMKDNVSFTKEFVPLNEEEAKAVKEVVDIFNSFATIPCTKCRYCVEQNHCPKNIAIPDIFACLNEKAISNSWSAGYFYKTEVISGGKGKASDCIKCGLCEKACPQGLSIRDLLQEAVKTFETN